jgi:hypothetical protein
MKTLVSLACFASAVALACAADPWLGTWELNLAKSRFSPGPGPRSETRTYTTAADGEKAVYDRVDAEGKRHVGESVYRFDGRDAVVTQSNDTDAQALTRAGTHSLTGVLKKADRIWANATRTVSADGRLLTGTLKGTSPTGQVVEESWVFDRVTIAAETARELLAKAVQHHDPQGKWRQFHARVRLVSNYSSPDRRGQNVGEEIIEIQNATDLYRHTHVRGQGVIVRGLHGTQLMMSVNGDPNPSEALIQQHGLTRDAIDGRRRHHLAHVGFAMEVAAARLAIHEPARLTEFNGRPAHAVSLDPQEGVHRYYNQTWTVYLDPQTHAVIGYRASSAQRTVTAACLGEFEVDGIKIPQTKIYSDRAGGYLWTDLFTRATGPGKSTSLAHSAQTPQFRP